MEMAFYRCNESGNIIIDVKRNEAPSECFLNMEKLVPNTVDAAKEKHVPVVVLTENAAKVSVGSVAHPMAAGHYIQWILLEPKNGYQIRYLNPGDAPACVFPIQKGDEVIAVYEYCNLHGLWKTSV